MTTLVQSDHALRGGEPRCRVVPLPGVASEAVKQQHDLCAPTAVVVGRQARPVPFERQPRHLIQLARAAGPYVLDIPGQARDQRAFIMPEPGWSPGFRVLRCSAEL